MKTFLKAVAAIVLAVSMVWASPVPEFPTYFVVRENATDFKATRFHGGFNPDYAYQVVSIGSIQEVIDDIRDNSRGEDCIIHFDGSGETTAMLPLDLGNKGIIFDNFDRSPEPFPTQISWGKITIKGEIFSEFHGFHEFTGLIFIGNGVSAEISGNIVNKHKGNWCPEGELCDPAVRFANAIAKFGTGTLTISSNADEKGYNIAAYGGNAIISNGDARVVISNNPIIYSLENPAIYIYNVWGGIGVDTALIINGGLIKNTAMYGKSCVPVGELCVLPRSSDDLRAIANKSGGAVVVNDGYIGGSVNSTLGADIHINGGTLAPIIQFMKLDCLANDAIVSNGNVFLSGNPFIGFSNEDVAKLYYATINAGKGKLHIAEGFAPYDWANGTYATRIYYLSGNEEGDAAVINGKNFLTNFRILTNLAAPDMFLYVSGNDLIATFDQGRVSITNKIASRNTANFAFAGISNGQINLNLQAGNYTAELYNLQGRMISRTNIAATNGVNATGLRTDNLARGVFILNVKQAGNSVLRQKISVR